MATKILELATKLELKSPDWPPVLRKRIESASLIQWLTFFSGDQTWAVGGQMANNKKKINLEGWLKWLTKFAGSQIVQTPITVNSRLAYTSQLRTLTITDKIQIPSERDLTGNDLTAITDFRYNWH